jgi:energy-coupling factor transporter ATP-binding protein EcfA2
MTNFPIISKVCLVVLVGPSGSGKSTLASKIFPAGEIYSSDNLRAELFGNFREQKNIRMVFRILNERIRAALLDGKRVVLDATNLKQRDRLAAIALAEGLDIEVIYLVWNRPLQEKLVTGGWRLEVDGLIEKHDRKFRQFEAQILGGDGGLARVIDARKTRFTVE